MYKQYYVYILASKRGTLYIGITPNLVQRTYQHKHAVLDGFTATYGIHILVYYEIHSDPENAIIVV